MDGKQPKASFDEQLMTSAINTNTLTDEEYKENNSVKDEVTQSINHGNQLHYEEKHPLKTWSLLKPSKSILSSIIINKTWTHTRRDRLGTLIQHGSKNFESEFKGTPPKSRKRKAFQVTFKDNAEGGALAKVVEVESFKKYNSLDPEIKLWWAIF